jgi:hypothetical protein
MDLQQSNLSGVSDLLRELLAIYGEITCDKIHNLCLR